MTKSNLNNSFFQNYGYIEKVGVGIVQIAQQNILIKTIKRKFSFYSFYENVLGPIFNISIEVVKPNIKFIYDITICCKNKILNTIFSLFNVKINLTINEVLEILNKVNQCKVNSKNFIHVRSSILGWKDLIQNSLELF